MSGLSILMKIVLSSSLLFLASCKTTHLLNNPLTNLAGPSATKNVGNVISNKANSENNDSNLNSTLSLSSLVSQANSKINVDAGSAKAVAMAVKFDPKVQLAKNELLQQQAKLGISKSKLDFQFSGTVYGGVEDVTDETNGIAAVLNASKLFYDGGQLVNSVSADEYAVQAALEALKAVLDESTLEVASSWVELQRYQGLNSLITDRLAVLDPVINQLERIAEAGIGDATQVAAAQRTVAMIRVEQTTVEERLAQAELEFTRRLGELPGKVKFDLNAIDRAVPKNITSSLVVAAPALLANYASYLSALKHLEAAKARNSVTIGLESKVQRPFGQSGYDSDESIGFVARKIFYNGDKLASEVKSAQAAVDTQEANVKNTYRRGREVVETAMQTIASMNKATEMARLNAQALRNEIELLRKQLVIGQSTLDSVLSAEARLYGSEAKEINFMADKHIAQLHVLSSIGLLSSLYGLGAESVLH